MLKISILLLSILFASELPKELTKWETENMHIIQEMRNRTEPPPGPVRAVAEYEPMQGVLIRYPFGISTSLIREMSEDVIIYCLVSSWSENSAARLLAFSRSVRPVSGWTGTLMISRPVLAANVSMTSKSPG